ncbi:hypothetical protein CHS0354_030629 [Potamilus streckersoni]|uniref:Uncharacterized protein n=1 Tax=Potamilus streckersoni TaxID=2493646 RepID=A0AAE0SD71_9BIVA|nr:hypothetical protein CHS0354_030629 [Potamilus streckersoni]
MMVYFSFVVILMCTNVASADVTKVSLDGPDSVCSGNPLEVKEGNELQLVSKGLVQTSMCSVRMNVQRSQNCRGVCFNLRSSNFADCSAKLITTEIHFRELVPDDIKEETCQKSMEVPWCSSAHTLKLDLVVDDMVMTPKFNFSATVYPRCGDDVLYKPPNRLDMEEKLRISLIHGIIVGICLCSAFLVIFLAAWCYYKNHPNRGHTMSSSVSKEKTLKISGKGAKQTSSSDPKATYRKIDEKENEEAKLMLAADAKS